MKMCLKQLFQFIFAPPKDIFFTLTYNKRGLLIWALYGRKRIIRSGLWPLQFAVYINNKKGTVRGIQPNLDTLRGILGFLGKTKMKAYTKLTVVMCCQIVDRKSVAPSSGEFWRRPVPR